MDLFNGKSGAHRMKKLIYFLTIIFALSLCTCSGGIKEMLDDYNSNFTPYVEIPLLPGEEGFMEDTMLFSIYHVPSTATLCLFAPEVPNAEYKWQIRTSEERIPLSLSGKEINLNQFDNDPNLVLYIPSLAIANGSYWLKLTVKINQGGEELVFTDSTELVIYEDIYKM